MKIVLRNFKNINMQVKIKGMRLYGHNEETTVTTNIETARIL